MVRRGWVKSRRMISRPTEFRASFIVAHSAERVEGIMGTLSTFNQTKYLVFLKQLLMKLENSRLQSMDKIVIVADNCRFHRTVAVKQFFMKKEVPWNFIPPYSPEINPWEKLINFIQMYIKEQIHKQKYISLK